MPTDRSGSRREFTAVLLSGAAGAGLIVLSARQAWAHAIFTPPRPLPVQDFAVTGQALVPLASALALAALACLAAVIATRSVVRRAIGVLLAALGVAAAAAISGGASTASVLATAQAGATSGALGGSTTIGTAGGGAHAVVIAGSAGRAVASGAPWRAVAIVGAVVIVAAGVATVWRGPSWPVMSARFERPGQPGRKPASDSSTMWESLSRDVDPTIAPTMATDQLDGGTRT
jgi:Tryptophan-associated transmembrane protein (Trp_oprn_chp)